MYALLTASAADMTATQNADTITSEQQHHRVVKPTESDNKFYTTVNPSSPFQWEGLGNADLRELLHVGPAYNHVVSKKRRRRPRRLTPHRERSSTTYGLSITWRVHGIRPYIGNPYKRTTTRCKCGTGMWRKSLKT